MTIRINPLDARPDNMPQAGDLWPMPVGEPFQNASLQFRSEWAGKRQPLVLKLPDESELNLDATTTGDGQGLSVRCGEDGSDLTVYGVLVGRSGRTFKVAGGHLQEVKPESAAPSAPDDAAAVTIK